MGGYRLWYYFEEQQSDKDLEALLDKVEYDEGDLITIRMPLSLPYQNDTENFERIAGEVNFKGKIFKYVKRKIENGEFVLLCLPDKNKMQIENQKQDLFRNTTDITQNDASKKSDNSKSISLKNMASDYDHYSPAFNINSLNMECPGYSPFQNQNLVSCVHNSPGQPPDASAS